jgi:isopentenyl-diphosphate Delta-isomerase
MSSLAIKDVRTEQAAILIPAIAASGDLYPIEKMQAHRLGVLHLAISVFVFHGSDLLIQRRAFGKYHCGGQWANSCCTHPHWGEDLDTSAARRLQEELGLSISLSRRGQIDYFAQVSDDLAECERVQIYYAEINGPKPRLAPDHSEVCETAWVDLDELKRDARARPQTYAPWLRIYLERWDELGL